MNPELLHQFIYRSKRKDLLGIAAALSVAIEARDPYTRGHSERVGRYAKQLALELGWNGDDAEELAVTGLLHDIGKIGIPESVLLKQGPLDPDEWELVKRHPVVGFDIVEQIEDMSPHLHGVRHHHEHLDGSGYPDGLGGEDIGMSARILAVADIWDALTSHRPYRAALGAVRSLEILHEEAALEHIDSGLVQAFQALYERGAFENLLQQAERDTNISLPPRAHDATAQTALEN